MGRVLYIINPTSYGGSGCEAWETFQTLWLEEIDSKDVVMTERPGHAREVAASRSDYEIITAVGGDGTVSEVISGVMEQQAPRPKVAIIPGGTGNDIAQNAGIFSVTDSVKSLHAQFVRKFDLVQIDYQKDGEPIHGHGFLFALAGFSANSRIRPWMKRLLGATGAYYLATFLQVLTYRAPLMTIRVDDEEFVDHTYMVIAGNAEWAGGGSMRMSPGALIDDGQLRVTIVPSMSKLNIITRLFPCIATGTHIDHPDVSYFAGKKIEVSSDPPAILDVDGDVIGTTPATFTICPGALQMVSVESPDKIAKPNKE